MSIVDYRTGNIVLDPTGKKVRTATPTKERNPTAEKLENKYNESIRDASSKITEIENNISELLKDLYPIEEELKGLKKQYDDIIEYNSKTINNGRQTKSPIRGYGRLQLQIGNLEKKKSEIDAKLYDLYNKHSSEQGNRGTLITRLNNIKMRLLGYVDELNELIKNSDPDFTNKNPIVPDNIFTRLGNAASRIKDAASKSAYNYPRGGKRSRKQKNKQSRKQNKKRSQKHR